MKRGRGLLAFAWLCLVGCTSFPTIESNVCGNGVPEPDAGEACDTFVRDGERCRPPGDVLECQYDCRIAADGSRAKCPDRQGCASDGVCREDTGDYEDSVSLSTEATSWLSTADFDGDERIDLVSSEPLNQLLEGRFRVHYFAENEASVTTHTFPRVTTRPVARDFDADGKSDFVFSNFRVGMVPGRADRDWLPATFSSYHVANSGLRVVGVYDDAVGGGSALVVLTELDGIHGMYVPDFNTSKLEPRADLRAPVQALAGVPIAADIVEGVESPCQELVLAFRGDDRFYVYDFCAFNSDPSLPEVLWRDRAIERVVMLPAGRKVDARPISADVDGDGHQDVIVGAEHEPYVAYGDGQGLTATAALLEVAIIPEHDDVVDKLRMPLAAGDLSGDDIADFVLPYGILSSRPRLSGGGVSYFLSYVNRGVDWSMAAVVDLNGNELLDVIAASEGVPGLSFMNGTGGPYQIGASLPSEGPLRFLTTGDFDGDLLDDVAFVESGPPADGIDFLALAFGTRDTPPLAGKRVAEVRGVEQLGGQGELGLDNLFMASTLVVAGEPVSNLTLFDGNPDRLPFATYSLVTFSFDRRLEDTAAIAVIAGSFVAPGSNDVMALGTHEADEGWTQWLAPDFAGAQDPPRLLKSAAPQAFPTTMDGASLSVAGIAADLDGDGIDEALWLMPQGPEACALLIYEIDARAGAATQKELIRFDEPCRMPQLAAGDQNRDGSLDVLLLLGAPGRVRVLWNDTKGGLSLADSLVLSDPRGEGVRAFSSFPGKPGHRIAFVTADGLYVAKSEREGEGDERNEASDKAYVVGNELASLENAGAVVALDPNGDGVVDLAVADATGIRLFEAELR